MFLRYNRLGFFWAFLILALCLMPGKDMPDLSFWQKLTFDKAAHMFFFSVFVLLLITGFMKQYSYKKLRFNAIKAALMIGVIYGGLTEVMQGIFVQDRYADLFDFMANSIGSLTGVASFFVIYGKNYSTYR